MTTERFRRTKGVVASSAIALVVAALVFGLSSLMIGPRSAAPQHVGFALASSPSSFTIASNVYPSPACAGSSTALTPGVSDCAVFKVQNQPNVPITVQRITTDLDTSFPAPPPQCAPPASLTLPTFSGSVDVGANATVNLPGVPIELKEGGTDQTTCENFTYHFVYSGGAQYTDSTSTTLTSSPNASVAGQSVSFTATVKAGNPGTDARLPSGPVSFYTCSTASSCIPNAANLLGTGNIGAGGVATFATTSLAVGTGFVEAVYPASGTDFLGSTSNVVSQVVNPTTIATSSNLTSSPNPTTHGASVTFTDTVTSGSGTPTGSVTFYSCTTSACSTKTSLGSSSLSAGKATVSTSTLPIGTTLVEAIYAGSGNYVSSTSNVVSQVVTVSVPSVCASGTYANSFIGSPAVPFIYGTNGSDFIYAFGGSFWINGFGKNDCIDAGDGNNVILDGDGNDGVTAGSGDNVVLLGDGNDKVSLGNGANLVQVGNGNDTITIGSGSSNQIRLGSGTDSVTVQGPGSHNSIVGGGGNETVYLGSGTDNSYSGQPHHTNVCHVPKPPSSWHGTFAAYYHDSVANCTVVTP
jgi:hypothetical protein